MKVNELPAAARPHLEKMVELLRKASVAEAGDAVKTWFSVEAGEPEDPDTSWINGKLRHADERATIIPVDETDQLSSERDALFRACRKAKRTLRMVHVDLERAAAGGKKWAPKVALESLEDHRALCKLLAPVEARLVELGLAAAGKKWDRISVSRVFGALNKRTDKLFIAKGAKVIKNEPPTPEMTARLEEADKIMAVNGRVLRHFDVQTEGGPGDELTNVTRRYYLMPSESL